MTGTMLHETRQTGNIKKAARGLRHSRTHWRQEYRRTEALDGLEQRTSEKKCKHRRGGKPELSHEH